MGLNGWIESSGLLPTVGCWSATPCPRIVLSTWNIHVHCIPLSRLTFATIYSHRQPSTSTSPLRVLLLGIMVPKRPLASTPREAWKEGDKTFAGDLDMASVWKKLRDGSENAPQIVVHQFFLIQRRRNPGSLAANIGSRGTREVHIYIRIQLSGEQLSIYPPWTDLTLSVVHDLRTQSKDPHKATLCSQ
jgi:hypothetical protein